MFHVTNMRWSAHLWSTSVNYWSDYRLHLLFCTMLCYLLLYQGSCTSIRGEASENTQVLSDISSQRTEIHWRASYLCGIPTEPDVCSICKHPCICGLWLKGVLLLDTHELFRKVCCKDLTLQQAAADLRRPSENTPLVLLISWMCQLWTVEEKTI